MTLEQIRQATNLNDLKPAIKYLVDNMADMGYGVFLAYRRTLQDQSVKVGSSHNEINKIAEDYQVFGYEVSK